MTPLRGRFRGRRPAEAVEPEPVVVPLATIDGWTLERTALARVPRRHQRELCTLLHGIAAGTGTAWTHLRAVALLKEVDQPRQAYAVCEAWLGADAAHRPGTAADTRALTRHRDRLRDRLAASAPGT